MKYPYLLLDADNTLFDFDAGNRHAFHEVCARYDIPDTDESFLCYERCNNAMWTAFDRGECTKDFLVVERFRLFLKEMGLDKNTIVVFSSDHGETMCSQRTDDPKNSPYSESMNVPFIVRYPDKIRPRVDNLMLSSPDIMPTLLGLCGLGDSIPAEVQGRNFAPLFFDEKADIVRPTGALYIQNLDGEKDENGLVTSYFPSSRGIKTHRYTMAFYIDRNTKQLKKSLLFDDEKDPYQMNNLSLEENKEVVKQLCSEMGGMLKEIDDPWYRERILSNMISYE